MMRIPKHNMREGKSFLMPVLGIVVLLAFYALLTDWPRLPLLVSSTLTSFNSLF